ncbi:hypothetical protein ANN_23670 [Periplaneta americana]|uniref:Uncharacterized protein n=1 Tax=Periplaneta americana TaxID=6978 RepID=A0ABQ8SMX8_PERAM|nr:hypothetical protein ANN_23670 [Periplaneta americana]
MQEILISMQQWVAVTRQRMRISRMLCPELRCVITFEKFRFYYLLVENVYFSIILRPTFNSFSAIVKDIIKVMKYKSRGEQWKAELSAGEMFFRRPEGPVSTNVRYHNIMESYLGTLRTPYSRRNSL